MNFDTHKAVKSLIAAGKFKPEQAEILVEIIQESKDADLVDMATKGDLIKLEAHLRKEMSEMRDDLRVEMSEMRDELREDMGDLRSKMSEMEIRFRTEMSKLRSEMSSLKFEILKWVFGINIVNVGAVVGLLKLLSF